MTETRKWRVGRLGCVVSDTPSGHIEEADHVAYYGGHLVAESIANPANAALIARAPDLLRDVEGLRAQNTSLAMDLARMTSEAIALRAQNAEMLEALVAARKAWVYEASQGDGIMVEHDQVIDAVDAAIAKAKGGAS